MLQKAVGARSGSRTRFPGLGVLERKFIPTSGDIWTIVEPPLAHARSYHQSKIQLTLTLLERKFGEQLGQREAETGEHVFAFEGIGRAQEALRLGGAVNDDRFSAGSRTQISWAPLEK